MPLNIQKNAPYVSVRQFRYLTSHIPQKLYFPTVLSQSVSSTVTFLFWTLGKPQGASFTVRSTHFHITIVGPLKSDIIQFRLCRTAKTSPSTRFSQTSVGTSQLANQDRSRQPRTHINLQLSMYVCIPPPKNTDLEKITQKYPHFS